MRRRRDQPKTISGFFFALGFSLIRKCARTWTYIINKYWYFTRLFYYPDLLSIFTIHLFTSEKVFFPYLPPRPIIFAKFVMEFFFRIIQETDIYFIRFLYKTHPTRRAARNFDWDKYVHTTEIYPNYTFVLSHILCISSLPSSKYSLYDCETV